VAVQQKLSAEKGVNTQVVSTDLLDAGVYFISLLADGTFTEPARFVKQ
jgi:hypothetical protein